jgi:predicted RNase H-like nuclease (RuvC/YqgF family)
MEGSALRLITVGVVGTLLGFAARHLLFQSKRTEDPVNCQKCEASAAATSLTMTSKAHEIKELKAEIERLQAQIRHKNSEVQKLKSTLSKITTKVRDKATAHRRLTSTS